MQQEDAKYRKQYQILARARCPVIAVPSDCGFPRTRLRYSLRHTADRDHGTPLDKFSLASACQHTRDERPVHSFSMSLQSGCTQPGDLVITQMHKLKFG